MFFGACVVHFPLSGKYEKISLNNYTPVSKLKLRSLFYIGSWCKIHCPFRE